MKILLYIFIVVIGIPIYLHLLSRIQMNAWIFELKKNNVINNLNKKQEDYNEQK